MTRIEEAKQKMDAAREEMRRLGKEGLTEALRELTKDLPNELTSIGWNQYTDYFNDGDECTFSVHADPDYGMKFNGEDGDELGDDSELRKALFTSEEVPKTWGDGGTYTRHTAIEPIRKLCSFLNENEEFLKEAIGDHITVTYHRAHAEGGERVETEECDHE